MSLKEDRPLDVIVFGATGFTGIRIVEELLRKAAEEGAKLKVGIAGRSRSRLEDVLKKHQVQEKDVPVLLADTRDEGSLLAMSQKTQLLISAVGPYRHYGEPVVKACVEAGTDYLDVSGEPDFIERMAANYHAKAVENGCLVISACGFDSIPADLGVLYTASRFSPPALPSSVESYLSIKTSGAGFVGHFGTYESLVYGIGFAHELRKLRASQPRQPKLNIPGPTPPRLSRPRWEPRIKAWVLPFMGSDASIVKRTQQTVSQNPRGLAGEGSEEDPAKPVYYSAYMAISSLWYMVLFMIFGTILSGLAAYGWGRKVLLKFPKVFTFGLFSHEGPTEEQMAATSFEFTFFGHGYSGGTPSSRKQRPDMHVVTRVSGPEPGYVATPTLIVQSALCLLEERSQLAKGGVHTAGAVFAFSRLRERLDANGIAFEDVTKAYKLL